MTVMCRMDKRDGIGEIKRKEDLLGLTKAQAKISVIRGNVKWERLGKCKNYFEEKNALNLLI